MNRKYTKAFNQLKTMGVPVREDDYSDKFWIEPGDWADYWRQDWGIFGVDERIDQVLSKHGLFAEWRNPEVLGVYQL